MVDRKDITSIAVKISTRDKLAKLKIHPREPFDEVIERLMGGKEE